MLLKLTYLNGIIFSQINTDIGTQKFYGFGFGIWVFHPNPNPNLKTQKTQNSNPNPNPKKQKIWVRKPKNSKFFEFKKF
jgi:hypothetical protein